MVAGGAEAAAVTVIAVIVGEEEWAIVDRHRETGGHPRDKAIPATAVVEAEATTTTILGIDDPYASN